MAQSNKGAKKVFFPVETPLTATKVSLLAYSAEELNGKVVKLDLTRSLRGKSLELRMQVKNEGGKLVGVPISLELAGSFVRRMIRNGIDYIEDSFELDFKDGKARVKPFLITRNKVSRAVRRELRNNAKKFIEAYFKVRNANELFSDIMTNKIQKELSIKLKKIYPLALCEIRVFEFVTKTESERLEQVKEEKSPEAAVEHKAEEDKIAKASENIAKVSKKDEIAKVAKEESKKKAKAEKAE